MTRPAYYNEKDEKAAAWLRELIAAGVIAPGFVDTRSIEDVLPSDLDGFAQCHFFAGIGVWSYALRRAGWPDDREVWTGSCPCQPFSAAGKGAGFADERHLWPAFFHLITQRRPPVVLGEQVASKDGLAWVDLVHADMEGADYSFRAVDLCAAGVGAPHIRQRLWFVGRDRLAHPESRGRGVLGGTLVAGDVRHVDGDGQPDGLGHAGRERVWRGHEHREHAGAPGEARGDAREQRVWTDPGAAGLDGQLGHAERTRREGGQPGDVPGTGWGREGRLAVESGGVVAGGLALTEHGGRAGRDAQGRGAGPVVPSGGADVAAGGAGGHAGAEREQRGGQHGLEPQDGGAPDPTNGPWRDADWLYCRDDKYRPVEPGTFPLAHESPARMVRLRGYGNGLVAEVAITWIEACIEEGLTC